MMERTGDHVDCIAFSSLRHGFELGQKLAQVGFDWTDARGPRDKVDEELRELDEAIVEGDRPSVEAELGDVLFALVNLARHLSIDPEVALGGALDRVEARFGRVEQRLQMEGRTAPECTMDELEGLWQVVKSERA